MITAPSTPTLFRSRPARALQGASFRFALSCAALFTLPVAAQDLSHRQSELTVTVRDADGAVVPGAEVRIELINPSFRWGTAVSGGQLLSPGNTPTKRYLQRYFNSVTFGNDMKWDSYERNSSEWFRHRLEAVQRIPAFGSSPMRLRGHVTVWANQSPADVRDWPSGDPEGLRTRIREHIAAYHEDFSGVGFLDSFDLYNEPWNERSLMNKLTSGSHWPNVSQEEIDEVAEWFRIAQEADPDAQLFINEYNILNGWSNGDHARRYKAYIDRLRDAGAPVGGIGLQGHIDRVITYEQFVERFAILAAPMEPTANFPEGLPGLPIEVSELDINPNVADREQEAVMIEDLLRAAFENPSVQGVTIWGMDDGSHWRDNAVMFDSDWNLKPSGQVWIDLVRGEYWTSETATADSAGEVEATVFKGRYRVAVRDGERVRSQAVQVEGATELEISLIDPTPVESYSDWLDNHFLASVDAIAHWADLDGDQRGNFGEYLFGTSPLSADHPRYPVITATDTDAVTLQFPMRKSALDSTEITLRNSHQRADLGATWQTPGVEPVVVSEDGGFLIYAMEAPWNGERGFFHIDFQTIWED